MKIETEEEYMEKLVRCSLIDPEGIPLGSPTYLSLQSGPLELRELANKFLNNEENLSYAFYFSDEEIREPIGTYLEEEIKEYGDIIYGIVYRQEAVFRTRPVNRISATIDGHTDDIKCVSFSPDGKQLASGSYDATLRLYDLETQKPLFTCRGHRTKVLSIAWSPDGKHLVSGCAAGEVCCWKPKTGELDGNPLTGHFAWILGISWEPVHLKYPCRRFVTCSQDGDARVWDITLKRCLFVLGGHTAGVTCVKWGGEGLIYTCSEDFTIKRWDFNQDGDLNVVEQTLQFKEAHDGNTNWVRSLALSTEYVLRTGAFDHTGKQYSSPEEIRKAALERYEQVKGKSGERLVSVNEDNTMILWENAQPKIHLKGHRQRVNHVQFSPNGQWIASASFDESVRIWDGFTGYCVSDFWAHLHYVYHLSWSPDSRLLISCSGDHNLKIWDIGQKKLKQNLPGHEDRVLTVEWSPDGERVVSGGYDRHLKLWVG